MVQQIASIEEVQQFVRSAERVRVVGGGSKGNLSRQATLSLSGLSGVIEYDPAEFTFTAWAGTPISEIDAILAEHGQYLPFDPPLANQGATLGGTLAAGLSGPGRYRYGGVRDFVISGRVVTGDGQLVRGGAKVVKNAAGFDIPKLTVGSLGCFGILIDLSFKVFPRPEKTATLVAETGSMLAAQRMQECIVSQPLDLFSVDIEPSGKVMIRVGGLASGLAAKIARVRSLLASVDSLVVHQEDEQFWSGERDFEWVPRDTRLLKIPMLPGEILNMEARFDAIDSTIVRRYSVGGNVLYLAWPNTLAWDRLPVMDRGGLVLSGDAPVRWLGDWDQNIFFRRLRGIFDPAGKF